MSGSTSDDGGRKARISSPGEALFAKTCQTCFALKIRCDKTQKADKCDRCIRLGKQCRPRPARRRDNSAKRDSRIQALEAQVQNLLRIKDPSHNAQQPLPIVNDTYATAATSAPTVPSVEVSEAQDEDVIEEGILTMERAEMLVATFKADMMPHFPFVIVPQQDTGQKLRHEKPMLFLAILLVASYHDLTAQIKLGDRFKQVAVEKVLHGADACLELEYLQALMIVVAWSHYFYQMRYTTQYLQMAVSIAVDMRLDRKPLHHKRMTRNDKRDPLLENNPGTQTWGPGGTTRSSWSFLPRLIVASKLLDKLNVFPCSPLIEEGCLSLGRTGEYRTDKDLYHIIRLQRIIEGIEKISRESNTDAEAHDAYLHVRSELEEFRVYLNQDLTDSHCLIMQFHIAKLFLYQVAFFERNLQQSPLLNLSMLCEGLESAKSFLDLYLWLPPNSEMNLTLTEWVQLSFGTTQATKFAIVSQSPNVETQTRQLRNSLNIEHLLRQLRLRVGALMGRGGTGAIELDVFSRYETRLMKVQTWYTQMSKATTQLPNNQYSDSASPPSTTLRHSSANTPSPHHQSSYPTSIAGVSPQSSSEVPLVPPSYSRQQQQQSYLANPIPMGSGDQLQSSMPNINMLPMQTYDTTYGTTPALSIPDFMNAPGWDALFSVPMEDVSWLLDSSSPGDPGWGLYNHDPNSTFE